jgi:hypothetical protein
MDEELEGELYQQQLQRDREIDEKAEKLNRAFYSTFHSMEGRVVLKYLLDSYYRRTSLVESADSNKTLINEGKRFVVIDILNHMEQISKSPED